MTRGNVSVRLRIAAAVAVTFGIALAAGSMLMVSAVRSTVQSSIAADNRAILEELREKLEAGADPRQLTLPFGTDGTQFNVENSVGNTIASSLAIRSGDVVLPGPPVKVDSSVVPEIQNTLDLAPGGQHADQVSLEKPHMPREMRAQRNEFDRRVEALADPRNWSKTELTVDTPHGEYALVALTPFDIINRSRVWFPYWSRCHTDSPAKRS